MLDSLFSNIRSFIPASIFRRTSPAYHWTLAFISALWYRFPSRHIKVIAVTGTKGKSSTVEILNAILEEAGHTTALSNTIRFKVAGQSRPNLYKMSMPGRGFMQCFLRQAVNAGCDYAVVEMTSQGALLYRHRFIDLDTLIFTNLSPEHIEAHGSYDKYRESKLDIARAVATSPKRPRTLIVNADDPEAEHFLKIDADRHIRYSVNDVQPYEIKKSGLDFTLSGRRMTSHLSGLFNLYNITAAITAAKSEGLSDDIIARAVEKFTGIAGRVEKIEAGQDFTVIVDYAHTTDSLEKLYKVFPDTRKICVLGGTGGGRDTGKRREMGRIADRYCDDIILTDEDPYDEDPHEIVAHVAGGIIDHTPTVIMDRREAIREAIRRAKPGDTILITGKGTDPYIMGPHGMKIPWSDSCIAKEEIAALSATARS